MKKTLLSLAIVALAAVSFVSCSSETSGDPKEVLKTFAERLAKKDFDGAAKLATEGSAATLNMAKMGMELAEKMKTASPENDPMTQLSSAEFGNAKIDGNTATVTVTNKANKDQPPVDITLVKENGNWKVDFSMAALAKMGKQQVNQGGAGANISLDSLSKNLKPQHIEKAVKAADSLMKHIDPKKLEDLQKQLEKLKQ